MSSNKLERCSKYVVTFSYALFLSSSTSAWNEKKLKFTMLWNEVGIMHFYVSVKNASTDLLLT
jgi:hypothetical protein